MELNILESIFCLSVTKLLTQGLRLSVWFCLFCYNISVAKQPLWKQTLICTASREDFTIPTTKPTYIFRNIFILVVKVNTIYTITVKMS